MKRIVIAGAILLVTFAATLGHSFYITLPVTTVMEF